MGEAKEIINQIEQDIQIVSTPGDWEMLYVDGILKHEDHSISISDVSRYVDGFEAEEEWIDVSMEGPTPETYEELRELEKVYDNFQYDCKVGDSSGMFIIKNINVDVNLSVFRKTSEGRRRYVDEFKGISPNEGIVVNFSEEDDVEDLQVQLNQIHNYSEE